MLEKYLERLKELDSVVDALIISPADVVTAPWVQYKCKFGCEKYGHSRCCPPNTPTWKETRELLDSYETAILVHGLEHDGERLGGVLHAVCRRVLQGHGLRRGLLYPVQGVPDGRLPP